jgi:hypothetical protein
MEGRWDMKGGEKGRYVKQNLKKVRKMGSKILRPIEMTKRFPLITY